MPAKAGIKYSEELEGLREGSAGEAVLSPRSVEPKGPLTQGLAGKI
jgi:hypothetical protein